jgi:transposase
MKKQFLKNLFGKKENQLIEKSVFDEQVNATRRILVVDAISSRLTANKSISLDWVREYNELTTKSVSPSLNQSELLRLLEQGNENFVDVTTLSQKDFNKSTISIPAPKNELEFEELKKSRKPRTRYTTKQINKVFRQVIKEVEQGVSVLQAIKNTGFSKGTFYVKISDYQKGKLKRTRLRANALK